MQGINPASGLINHKNLLLQQYNSMLARDSYGNLRPKPGLETQYMSVVSQLNALDQQIAAVTASGNYQAFNSYVVQPPQPQQTTIFNVGSSSAANNAKAIAAVQQPAYPVYNQAPQQPPQPLPQTTPTIPTKESKPVKEKIYVGGSLPYLEYLCDVNHKVQLSKRTGDKNEYSYEVLVEGSVLLDWDNSSNVNGLDSCLGLEQGAILANGFRVADANQDVIKNIRSNINNMFASLIASGRKQDKSIANNAVSLTMRQRGNVKGNKLFMSSDGLYFYLIPLVVIDPIKGSKDYYRISKSSHNLLYNKLNTLINEYNLVMVGWYDSNYSSFTRYLVINLDDEFGAVTTNLNQQINWVI